jgi:catalase
VLDRVVDNFFAETEQVAFCTQNVVPGIDFTNDPLLQGRNFSYLDTQLKRLGSPNFTYLPVNAPRCPVAHFQQDGHMAVTNPAGRANYEPNSWPAPDRGPREDPDTGFRSVATTETGDKRRIRPASFADHYSQARLFYESQMPVEQRHIVNAFVFELSKVETPAIRSRMVANLRNVDDDLATQVATGLGLAKVPDPSTAAAPTMTELPPSPALSIVANGPTSFSGRKLGLLVTDGADADVVTALRDALTTEGAVLEIVAPAVGGVELSDGALLEADQKIDGGPSVLYDAVAVLGTDDGMAQLAGLPAAKDFVSDAFAHAKFVGFSPAAATLFTAAGVTPDDGFLPLGAAADAESFVDACRSLRFWTRETW